MGPHSSYEHALRRIFPGCAFRKTGKFLTLPYQSRDPLAVQDLIRESIYIISCGKKEEKVLVFLVKGLRDKIIVCRGSNISVHFEGMSSSDSLSGLTLRLRRPVLYIDGCRIVFTWKKSRFVLSNDDVLSCTNCISIVP